MKLDQQLSGLATRDKKRGIKVLFAKNKQRVQEYAIQLGSLYFDFSKTHMSDELIQTYAYLADEINFSEKRKALFSGDCINISEQRSVLHTLLRSSQNLGLGMVNENDCRQAIIDKQKLTDQVHRIVEFIHTRKEPIKNIIHVGIGGSALGPQMLYEALAGLEQSIRVHFVSNVDAHQLVDVLSRCEVNNTLVVGVSKTFTTIETLTNLKTIQDWFQQQDVNDYQNLFFAVTANPQNAMAFGIEENAIVSFSEWIGGRYSIWSAVSLSVAIVLGMKKFNAFLEGASELDEHFYHAPYSENLCFLAAMLDHYYGNYFGAASRATFAYDFRLRSFVDYLQQLETESNGKDRDLNGRKVKVNTSAVVWGGVGTDVQHSVFQLLHQGTQFIPAEFILVKNPDHNHTEHHKQLLANGLAQPAALLAGQSYEEVVALNQNKPLSDVAMKAKVFAGEKPSTTILMESLTPKALGCLVAFYEHRTFCSGMFANINSFDQMGVELGKRLASEVQPLLQQQQAADNQKVVADQFDPSTAELLSKLKEFS